MGISSSSCSLQERRDTCLLRRSYSKPDTLVSTQKRLWTFLVPIGMSDGACKRAEVVL